MPRAKSPHRRSGYRRRYSARIVDENIDALRIGDQLLDVRAVGEIKRMYSDLYTVLLVDFIARPRQVRFRT